MRQHPEQGLIYLYAPQNHWGWFCILRFCLHVSFSYFTLLYSQHLLEQFKVLGFNLRF